MSSATIAEEKFDKGAESVPITFKMRTSHLKTGQSTSMHINPAHLLQIAGVPHADALNVNSVSIKTHSNTGLVGVSLLHSKSTGSNAKFVSAVENHTLADASNSTADVFHAVHGHSFTEASKIQLVPDESQLESNKVLTQKRFGSQWLGMNESHVTKGVVKSTLNGESRYLVTSHCSKTKDPSAIHVLLTQNLDNKKFMGGKYSTGGRFKPTTVHGMPAFTLEEADYHTIKDQLSKSLVTKSGFQHGLGVRLTKLDNTASTDANSLVQVTLHRTPMSKESGLVSRDQVGVSMTELTKLNGGADGATKVNTASGFEDQLKGVDGEPQPILELVDELSE